jgi:hypothetical protein
VIKQLKVNQKFYCNKQCTKSNKEKGLLSSAIVNQRLVPERSVHRGVSSQVREMREKRNDYIGQDVSQILSAATWWFVWLYNTNTPPQTYQNTVLISQKLSSVKY